MGRIPGIRRLMRLAATRNTVAAEVDDEVRFHLDARIGELQAQGLSADEARAIALSEFGDVHAARSELTDIDHARLGRTGRREWWGGLVQDLRFALRSLGRQPSWTAAAIATLALGIGANAAIFSVVDAVLLRPLPYADPGRLVSIWPNVATMPVAIVAVRDQARSFAGVASYGMGEEMSLIGGCARGDCEPTRVTAGLASAALFDVLGARALAGRTFVRGEDAPGRDRIVVLGHALWRQRFGADRSVIGKQVTLDGLSRTVVGIMPPEFRSLTPRAQLWVPASFDRSNVSTFWGGGIHMHMVARLRPGVALTQARTETAAIIDRSRSDFPWRMPDAWGRDVNVVPLQDQIVGGTRATLLILFGAVGLVLLIACVNVANLFVSRAAAREREIAIRVALGAGRWRVMRQLLTESILLGVVGAAAGLLLAFVTVQSLVTLLPPGTPRVAEIGIDGHVLGFTMALALLTGVAFGLVPALRASRPGLRSALATGSGSMGGTVARRRVAEVLVVAQVALAVILVTGAGLLIKSFWLLQRVDPGFRAEQVVAADVPLPSFPSDSAPRARIFYDAVLLQMRGQPYVRAAAFTSVLPFGGGIGSAAIDVDGHPTAPGAPAPMVDMTAVTSDYRRVMGIPLVRGRDLTEADREGSLPVALVDQSAVRTLWPGEDPIGKRLKYVWQKEWITIIGIVGSVKRDSLNDVERPAVYRPMRQALTANVMHLVVRASADGPSVDGPSADVGAIARTLRRAVAAVDPTVPVSHIQSLGELVSASAARPRFMMLLLAVFAGVALALGAVGIYGVIAYAVTRRTREIGVRMALGAESRDVLRMILRMGGSLAGIGVVAGLLGALAASRLLAGLLYGVTPSDPLVFAVVPVLLAAIACIASLVPARRAARVDPLIAMRAD